MLRIPEFFFSFAAVGRNPRTLSAEDCVFRRSLSIKKKDKQINKKERVKQWSCYMVIAISATTKKKKKARV